MSRTPVVLMLGYLAVLLILTFLPYNGLHGTIPVDLRLQAFRTINFALRKGPGTLEFAVLVGNLIAFIPLGLLLPAMTGKRYLLTVFLVGLALSLAIEAGQLAISIYLGFAYRTADIDDVIVNVSGALLGYGLFITVASIRSWVANGTNANG